MQRTERPPLSPRFGAPVCSYVRLRGPQRTPELWLGPPKTEESARTVSLPPFLVRLLRAHLATHHHEHVFITPDNALHRRSNFRRRALRPAADGNLEVAKPRVRLQPAFPGLTFHGLRHSHKPG